MDSTRQINLFVLHCSDTRPSQNYTLERLQRDHRARGFGAWPGYHVYIRRDGTIHYCRPISEIGCHVKNWNAHSIGICYEGGHAEQGAHPIYIDNRTDAQKESLRAVFSLLHEIYPDAVLRGHHELDDHKACPCLAYPPEMEYRDIFKHPYDIVSEQ